MHVSKLDYVPCIVEPVNILQWATSTVFFVGPTLNPRPKGLAGLSYLWIIYCNQPKLLRILRNPGFITTRGSRPLHRHPTSRPSIWPQVPSTIHLNKMCPRKELHVKYCLDWHAMSTRITYQSTQCVTISGNFGMIHHHDHTWSHLEKF